MFLIFYLLIGYQLMFPKLPTVSSSHLHYCLIYPLVCGRSSMLSYKTSASRSLPFGQVWRHTPLKTSLGGGAEANTFLSLRLVYTKSSKKSFLKEKQPTKPNKQKPKQNQINIPSPPFSFCKRNNHLLLGLDMLSSPEHRELINLE